MGKLHNFSDYLLGLLCAASFAFSSVASAGTVSVDVSPTTGYSVTNRSTVALPPRTTTGAVQAYNPTLGPLAGGGAYQTTSSTITITAIKDGAASSTTMTGRLRASAGAMKNGLTRCLTSFRCNAALMAASAGIESLFDGIDWVMGEGGAIYKKTAPVPEPSQPDCPSGSQCNTHVYATGACSAGDPGCSHGVGYLNACNNSQFAPCYLYRNGSLFSVVPSRNNALWPLASTFVFANSYTHGFYINRSGEPIGASRTPVSRSEIPATVDSNYIPDPSDLPYLSTGGLDWSHPGIDFEILDIPSVTGSTAFTENSDGTSRGTFSHYDFTWSPPGKQPEVNVKEKDTETTYGPSGEVIGTTTTTVNNTGSSANVPPEYPTDCEFMPTVCRFIDWFTEPDPEQGTEPDFSQLIDTIDIEREFTVGSTTAACPAPFHISLAWVPSVEVSLQPFCDLADLLRPFLLSLCFLYSGMIVLRT